MIIRVADEVWIATALLHHEKPEREGFTVKEIVDRVAKEDLFGRLRPGVQTHAQTHCIATKRPDPGRYRMLTLLENKKRRIYRSTDDFHPWREGSKTVPKIGDIPEKYHYLLDWYKDKYNNK